MCVYVWGCVCVYVCVYVAQDERSQCIASVDRRRHVSARILFNSVPYARSNAIITDVFYYHIQFDTHHECVREF